MKSPNRIRVGVVGAGYVSTYHLRALRSISDITVVGIADTSKARAEELAEKFQIAGVYGSLDEMAAAQPNVIHVLTPPSSHSDVTLRALAMGCDVFVEKPMAPTVRECDAMIAAALRAGRTVTVNHSAKADPVVVRSLELLKRGVCGDVVGVDFHRSSDYPLYAGGPLPAAFRDGGYPFQDIGVHALYLIEAFLGDIRDVDVRYRSTGRDPGVFFDEWRGTVDCAKGTGHFFLSWSARPMRNELFVHGTKGYMHIDCFLQTCTVHKTLPGPKAITGSIDAVTTALGTLYKVPRNTVHFVTGKLRPSPGIHAGIVQFYDARRRGLPPPVTAEEGRRVVGWIENVCRRADAARDAAFQLKKPVAPARVLVTGASGFLGRALLERLQSHGESVRVLVRRPSTVFSNSSGVEVVYGDLGDPEAVDRAVAGVDVVYHVGATMRARGREDFQAATVCGTANVVQSCLRHSVRRLVHVSSLTVLDYATPRQGEAVNESAALEPYPEQRGAYTQAKLQAERIVRAAVQKDGLSAVILRPGQIFGRGAESVAPYGTIAIGGRWLVIGSGKLRLPLVFVEDVVDALISAATRPGIEGAVFHLVDDAAVTQSEYIAMCRQSAIHVPRVVHVNRAFLYAIGGALESVGRVLGRGVPISRYRVQSIKELTFDCGLAKKQLEWKPAVGTNGGLRVTFGSEVPAIEAMVG